MSIRGIITLGLLDSPSEIITLGLDAGVSVPPTVPGVEWRASGSRLHYSAGTERLHYRESGSRLHYEAKED